MSDHLNWCSELIRSLYEQGVRHTIISPGSRSTPLTIAAAIHPGLRKRVVLDERSAAFIALGIGKATGAPALLICTSGTAASNYLPAVTEAKESGVPMILLTADRPPHLRGIGSSQTINQIGLYGDQAIFFHEAGEPNSEEADLRRLRYLGKQAVDASIRKGGASHINLPFRKPLEPGEESIKIQQELNRKQIEAIRPDMVNTRPSAQRTVQLRDDLSRLIRNSERPLIIAGPANPHQRLDRLTLSLAKELNAPIVPEPGSGIELSKYTVTRYEQFLRKDDTRKQLKPDLIIRTGDQPFTKSVLTAIESWKELPVIHFTGRDAVQDHAMNVTEQILIHPQDHFEIPQPGSKRTDEWLQLWSDIDLNCEKQLESTLESSATMSDPHVFRQLGAVIPENWNVMLSNSLIPRDMAMIGKQHAATFVNRGAAGIDGITSTAIGVRQATEAPTLCITGDLAFLHDAGSLLTINNGEPEAPLVILVINNGGGTIFRMLPVFEQKDLYRDYFETPQQADISLLARSYGINYQKIDRLSELKSLNLKGITEPQVIEIITDPDESMRIRKELWNG
ncbi:MAG: 2-succinyl-5-enolpyruvyl-6-hydroxy-3-cyclohexene-1-carboxylic-acid synthase [Balneolaceae bacterium]|nr:2-succinyl-5-enolpyruvyl-6-hydroxy-3-cyclohexene-1-carboxylic-acid synthase [Balneolaceae bacterium]MCH8548697.1 2-succinyl-5-enolpyruvyl-6-hydroxy-3-cyclohexene-1-carboxylic-acid synthase [Balneolaceae bacterium]